MVARGTARTTFRSRERSGLNYLEIMTVMIVFRYCDKDRPSVFEGATEYKVLFKSDSETLGDRGGKARVKINDPNCPLTRNPVNIICPGICSKCNFGKRVRCKAMPRFKSICCCWQFKRRCRQNGKRPYLPNSKQCRASNSACTNPNGCHLNGLA